MPGILGLISHRPAQECQAIIEAMIDSVLTEDFYSSGSCFAPEMGVYCGWVAHKASFAESQSSHTGFNDAKLLFSGNCDPCPTLSSALNTSGTVEGCEGPNDLLRLYQRDGDRFVGTLNGQFSGVLIDSRENRAILFNDRFGVERIYVHESNGDLFFASEAKAILRVVPETRAFDDQGVADFLTFSSTQNCRTLFRGIRTLPAGSIWSFANGALTNKNQYFQPGTWERQNALSEGDFEDRLLETFSRILARYTSSASPTGISLTGGLDTRLILAALDAGTASPICYTFTGPYGNTLDVTLAARVAKYLGFEHRILSLDSEFLSDFRNYVDKTVTVTDGCAGAVAAHEIYLNAKARELSNVRLTGNFGSEILRGMTTFKPLGLSNDLLSSDIQDLQRFSLEGASSDGVNPVTFAVFREVPWNLHGLASAARSQQIVLTPYLDNEVVALAYRAPPESLLSSGSTERVIGKLNQGLSEIPTDRGLICNSRGLPHLLRRLYAEVTFKLDYISQEGFPKPLSALDPLSGLLAKTRLVGLHKFLPYGRWFQREVSSYVVEVIDEVRTKNMPYWNDQFLAILPSDHIQGRRNLTHEINAVLTLEAADRLLIRGLPKHTQKRPEVIDTHKEEFAGTNIEP